MLDLPPFAVNLLNVCGIPWPYINEDEVEQFGQLVMQFANTVATTHNQATAAVEGIAQAYQSGTTQAMESGWANLTSSQVNVVVEACQALARALGVAAQEIVVQKGIAIAALAEVAVEVAGEVVAAVETFGLSLTLAAGSYLAVEKALTALVNYVEQEIIGQIISVALEALVSQISKLGFGLNWSQSGGTAGQVQKVELNQAQTDQQVAALESVAAAMRGQLGQLTTAMGQLNL